MRRSKPNAGVICRCGLVTEVAPDSTGVDNEARELARMLVLSLHGLRHVDLDTADPLVGLRRVIALGGESRQGPRLFVRGGVRWQRGADRRPVGALGASLLVRPGFWLDGYFTPQSRDDGQGFGVALRVGL